LLSQTLPTGPHILIATGGSGGHLFPAFAVADEIECRWPEAAVTLTTGPRDIEREVCAAAGREAIVLPLPPGSDWKRRPVRFARSLLAARRAARRLIDETRPSVVVGTGGFAMTPVVSAAIRRNVPVVLLEQNATPGAATRWSAKKASAVCSSFERLDSPLAAARIEFTGNPVRPAIAALAQSESRLGESLLILGGSQGARALNESLAWLAVKSPALLSRRTVIHQTGGEESARELAGIYERNGIRADVRPFFVDMAATYANAGLVIARAGATTLAELACAGLPAVLVPYPYARDLHQHANARVFAKRGAAVTVEEGIETATTAERLQTALESLESEESRSTMSRQIRALARPDAAKQVVDVIESLI
jgi:UDP-N-acetylglucosamine--N-acetylmuramyl-(pentapeptide) pyrophosphoryl-undecaprenol N-acetylglucosamine transferase